MPVFKQIHKSLDELSQRHRRYAELLAIGDKTKRDCLVAAGFSRATGIDLIGADRERSRYPALWDYYQARRKKHLRLFDVTAESIRDELRLVAFAKLTDFVAIPTRRDLQRQALFDAKIRQSMGYTDPEDEALIAQEDQIRQELSDDDSDRKHLRFAPGATVKLKALEDMPEELLPAIAEISETRDGIRIKLHNKLDALDKLARLLRLYDAENESSKSTTIENLNVIVNGTKSDLLNELDKI